MTRSYKSFAAIICVVALLFGTAAFSVSAAETDTRKEPIVISYTEIPLYVDDDCIGSGFMIDSVTYVPLLSFCEEMLDSECVVSWVQEDSSVTLENELLHITLTFDDNFMAANGRYLYLPSGAYNINGTTLVPIRELCKVFNVECNWDDSEFCIVLDTDELELIESGEEFYDKEDLYWLSRVIFSESGNQPLEGMIGVGNVVTNRKMDPAFADSIYSVIFEYNQFDVVKSGAIYFEPSEEAVIAAKLALEGYNTVGDSKFFFNPYVCSGGWIRENKTYCVSIGEHDFYA